MSTHEYIIGSFLPITLEQLAREHGVLKSNKSVSCIPKADEKGEDGVQAAAKHLFRRAKDGDGDNVCVVQPFGREVTTASFAMYTFSIAVLVQAICLISFSSVADYGKFKISSSKTPSAYLGLQERTAKSCY